MRTFCNVVNCLLIMQKRFVFLLVAVLLCLSCIPTGAYTPTTSWPYAYETFSPGSILTRQGTRIDYDRLNLSLVSGRVHYVEDGVIMQADPNSTVMLEIGDELYRNVGGRMTRVLKETDRAMVLLSVTIDTDAMSSADIGYGKSSVASTSNLSLTAISSGMDYSVNRSLDDLTAERSHGEPLVLREVRGVYYKGAFVPATRSDVLKIPGIDKDAVKRFLKENKIKFNNIDDLAVLADYLCAME